MSDLMSENSFSASDNFSENSIDRRVSFRDTVEVTSAVDYERRSKQKWMKLSTMDKMQIRLELNKYKMAEMTVHPESVKHNQYYEFPTEITQPMKRHVFQPKLRIVRIGAIR